MEGAGIGSNAGAGARGLHFDPDFCWPDLNLNYPTNLPRLRKRSARNSGWRDEFFCVKPVTESSQEHVIDSRT
jgi:hypothetical protein